MMKKITAGAFALVLSVGGCLLYQATRPPVAEPSIQPTAGQIRPPENQTTREEPAQTPTVDLAADAPANANEAREEEVLRVRSARQATLRRLLQQINEAMLASDPNARDRFQSSLAELVRSQPEAAARFAESLEAGEMRAEALRRVAQGWTAQDPTSAEKWAAQLGDQAERLSALSDVCFAMAQTNAAQALFKAEQYGLGAASGEVLENLVQQWAGQDFSRAENWVERLPDGEQRDQMLSRMAIVESAVAPAAAAQLVVNQIPPGPIQTEAAIAVLHQWAVRDLDGARSWVKLFPAGPMRDRADAELDGIAAYQHPY